MTGWILWREVLFYLGILAFHICVWSVLCGLFMIVASAGR